MSSYGAFKSHLTALCEGVKDRHILKAVFLAGGGGSGKSSVADAMFLDPSSPGGGGFKNLSVDKWLERWVDPADFKNIGSNEYQPVRAKAREARKAELRQYATRRLPLLIDGTAWKYSDIEEQYRILERMGYDCYMVHVAVKLDTALRRNKARADAGGRSVPDADVRIAWEGFERNKSRYEKLFGPGMFYTVSNDEDLTPEQWTAKVNGEIKSLARQILNRPLKNKVGVEWLSTQSNPATADYDKVISFKEFDRDVAPVSLFKNPDAGVVFADTRDTMSRGLKGSAGRPGFSVPKDVTAPPPPVNVYGKAKKRSAKPDNSLRAALERLNRDGKFRPVDESENNVMLPVELSSTEENGAVTMLVEMLTSGSSLDVSVMTLGGRSVSVLGGEREYPVSNAPPIRLMVGVCPPEPDVLVFSVPLTGGATLAVVCVDFHRLQLFPLATLSSDVQSGLRSVVRSAFKRSVEAVNQARVDISHAPPSYVDGFAAISASFDQVSMYPGGFARMVDLMGRLVDGPASAEALQTLVQFRRYVEGVFGTNAESFARAWPLLFADALSQVDGGERAELVSGALQAYKDFTKIMRGVPLDGPTQVSAVSEGLHPPAPTETLLERFERKFGTLPALDDSVLPWVAEKTKKPLADLRDVYYGGRSAWESSQTPVSFPAWALAQVLSRVMGGTEVASA